MQEEVTAGRCDSLCRVHKFAATVWAVSDTREARQRHTAEGRACVMAEALATLTVFPGRDS